MCIRDSAYIGRVVDALRRKKRKYEQDVRRRFLHDDAILANLRRYGGRRHLDAVVDVYRRLVGVRAELKCNGERHISLPVADGVHIDHVVDAVYPVSYTHLDVYKRQKHG